MRRSQSWDADRFTWAAPVEGFRWVQDAERANPLGKQYSAEGPRPALPSDYLLPTRSGPAMIATVQQAKPIYPLEESMLFLRFAKLDCTQPAILGFANEYGPLGVREPIVSQSWRSPDGTRPVLYGEWFDEWIKAIHAMWPLVWIWEMLQKNDVRRLGQHIIWRPQRNTVFFNQKPPPTSRDTDDLPFREGANPSRVIIADNMFNYRDQFQLWKPGDPIEPARFFLTVEMNKHMVKAVSSFLMLDEDESFIPITMPRNLLGALWLQFYRAITGETRLRQCEVCMEWMDVTNKNRNKRQHKVCGSRERQRRYRDRKKAGHE